MRTNLHHGEFLLRSELIELAAIATISFHAASRFAERTDKALSPESLRNYIVHSRMAFFQANGRIILMGDNTSEYFIFERNGICLTFVKSMDAQNALSHQLMKAMNGGKNSYGNLY